MIGLFMTRMEVVIAIMRMMNRGRGRRNAVGGGGGVKGVDTHRIGYGKKNIPYQDDSLHGMGGTVHGSRRTQQKPPKLINIH